MKIRSIEKRGLKTIFIIIFLVISYENTYAQFGNGYASPASVTKGDSISFFISTSQSSFSINVYKIGSLEQLMGTYNNIKGGLRTDPDSVWESGCNWPVSFTLKIPDSWTPGAYVARFPTANGSGSSNIIFFVKEKNPGSYADILIIIPVFNYVAYNNYGGKNVYDENSTNSKRAYRVSFNRPYPGNGYSEFRAYISKLINWLENNEIKYEVASEMDEHKNSDLLKSYKLVITAGHAEYYSRAQRRNIENYINNGGKYMSLSGNTCWWQIRIEDNDNTLVCYKNRQLDPLNGKADSLVTVNWYDVPLNLPENLFLGASFRNAGYVNDINHRQFMYSQGFGDYAAHNTQNWMFNGTGLSDGDEFGRDPSDSALSVVGYEVDGALFNYKNGIPEVTGFDGTPLNFRIIGSSPAIGQGGILDNRNATAGIYYTKTGGAVFNGSSIYWVYGLVRDQKTQRITLNIINKFLQNRFPPEITGWSPFVLDSATVNDQKIQINKRDLAIKSGDKVTFTVKTQDPYGEKVKYIWYVDSVRIGTDSAYTYNSKGGGIYTVKVLVYNSKDTSSINWTLKVNGPVNGLENTAILQKYNLEQNYPNPFNPSTTIRYSLAHESNVRIVIFNAIGQIVAQPVDKLQKAGNYEISWKADEKSTGIYFYSIEANSIDGKESFRSVRKMTLVK